MVVGEGVISQATVSQPTSSSDGFKWFEVCKNDGEYIEVDSEFSRIKRCEDDS